MSSQRRLGSQACRMQGSTPRLENPACAGVTNKEYMMSERVTISVENHIADVRFNRPDKMNALDAEQIDAIVEAGEKLG